MKETSVIYEPVICRTVQCVFQQSLLSERIHFKVSYYSLNNMLNNVKKQLSSSINIIHDIKY